MLCVVSVMTTIVISANIGAHDVATLCQGKCEDETHTLEIRTWESSGTPETSEFDYRGQNTSPRGVLYSIGKLLKCRCLKWSCMDHLDISAQVMAKRRAGSQTGSLTPNH